MRSDLWSSSVDGAAFGGMVGFGETYVVAFVLALGLGELMAGLVGSVPLLAGGMMQTVSPRGIRLLGSHKRWVVLCAFIQALTFVPLLWAAWLGAIDGALVLIVTAVYWAAGLATGPAWNTWIGTVVPPAVRPRFFALRSRASQAAVFVGVLVGGFGLQYAAQADWLMPAYVLLFSAALLCRLVSVAMLARQSEPVPIPPGMREIPWRDVWHHLFQGGPRNTPSDAPRHPGPGRLLVYLIAVQAAVQTAGPFFTPFMFEKLNLSYGQFVTLIAIAFLAKMLALPVWGRLASRIGSHRLLWIGGAGIVPLGAAWLVSQQMPWLLCIQIYGGITWAAYELAFFLLVFEAIKPVERTSLLTLYNLLNTVAFVVGGVLGGALLFWFNASYTGYLVVFTLSSVGRALALLLLARVPAESPEVEELLTPTADEVAFRPLSVRPNATPLDAPVLPTIPTGLTESMAETSAP